MRETQGDFYLIQYYLFLQVHCIFMFQVLVVYQAISILIYGSKVILIIRQLEFPTPIRTMVQFSSISKLLYSFWRRFFMNEKNSLLISLVQCRLQPTLGTNFQWFFSLGADCKQDSDSQVLSLYFLVFQFYCSIVLIALCQ